MADFDNRLARGAATTDAIDAGLRAHMLRVYNYMLVGLLLTGGVAWATASTPFGTLFYNFVQTANGSVVPQPNILGWIAIFAPIGLVLLLSFRIAHMSFAAAQATFWGYAALVGVSLSTILFAYTGASVATTFFVTAGAFGAMSLWGYTTGRDLTGMGSFLFMGLIGLILAQLANMFFHSGTVAFVTSVIGVLIFTGLTAYDTQSIKNLYYAGDDAQTSGKKAVMGALRLYLDFLNLFLYLLRFMGNRR